MAMSMGSYAGRTVATNVVATDGTGDFTDIQTAINALPTGGGVVYIKEGTYTISDTISIVNSNTALMGAGRGTIITLANSTNKTMIQVGDGTNACVGAVVADVRLEGNSANNTGTIYGIHLRAQATDAKIERCWVNDVKSYGIVIGANSDKNIITECTVSNCLNVGIYLAGSTIGNIAANNICYANKLAGIATVIANNVISNNICYSTVQDATGKSYGIAVSGDGNTVDGNYCYDNESAEIYVGLAYWGNVISNNLCRVGDGHGIHCRGYDCAIEGNAIRLMDKHGIFIEDAERVTVTGNTVDQSSVSASNTYSGICVDDSLYTIVSSNHFSDTNPITPLQKYGVEEQATSDYSLVIGNTEGIGFGGGIGYVTGKSVIVGANSIEVNNL